jgi:hypothetical protein
MEDSTNVNEFENPGQNGDSSQTYRDFASGLDLCKVTKINTQREKLEGNTTG